MSWWAREHRETVNLTLVLTAVVVGVFTVAVVAQCNGQFTYTLDDPYIHLALAKNLRHLHYGLNAGEVASPASSILWPFLLAPFAGTAIGEYMPLLFNALAAGGLALVVLALLRTLTDGAALRKPIPTAVGVVALLLFTNVFTSVFTGMEHVAQIAATAAVATGLVVVRREQRIPWWLIAGLVVGPALRYEGIVVTAAATVVLFVWGQRRVAVLSALAGATPVVAFTAWLLSQGLSPVPSSVLVKSTSTGRIDEFATTLTDFPRVPLLALLVGVLTADALWRGLRNTTALHGFALAVLIAQAANADWGSLSRYLPYAFFAALPVLGYLYRERVIALYASDRTGPRLAALGVVLAISGWTFANFTFQTPRAAQNIYLQQAQMGRFVQDYWQRPVAVNDLGAVGLRSNHYVLDLWGLGNQTAREERQKEAGVAWMDRLARQYDVDLAMVYRYAEWFPKVPAAWVRVGQLSFDVGVVSAAHERVTFYATTPAAAADAEVALEKFRRTLPPGARFQFA